ncbi:MAG: peptidyl-prolyl cis-trans isomerase [Bacteroidales bacterium]|nr:peptidyl-prolyl cis-trans isomerase [Bacteroidales bacterium]
MINVNIKRILILLLIIFALSCSKSNNEIEDIPLARVHNKFLYKSDIKSLFNSNISKEDSIVVARNYINDWIKKQLLMQKAELNLNEESKDIEKQIEDYRSSLLIFRYKQELIKQKLDTIITNQEIENYYNEYSGNFILNHNIVKALFLKVSKEAPENDKVKRWYKSNDPENLSRLEDYCYQYATKFDDFNNKWIPFNNLLIEIPTNINDQERYLRYNKYIETEDDLFYYFVKINEYGLKSTVQPLEYAQLKIKSILLNKRKFTFIDELENTIYNDALNRNEFIIY